MLEMKDETVPSFMLCIRIPNSLLTDCVSLLVRLLAGCQRQHSYRRLPG